MERLAAGPDLKSGKKVGPSFVADSDLRAADKPLSADPINSSHRN